MRKQLGGLVGLMVAATFVTMLTMSCSGSSSVPYSDAGGQSDGANLCAHCGAQACCNNVCVDTNTDMNNCGACGNACLPGPSPECVMGMCGCSGNSGQACAAGDTCCTNGCKKLLTDATNCGECGKKCTGNQTCTNGQCSCGGATCTGTQICCNNACVDKNTDKNNCGFCGNQCQGASAVCTNGLCSGNNNCGPGGTPCPTGQQCCPNICCTTCLGGVCMDGQDAGT
jgi:hypothetical protein